MTDNQINIAIAEACGWRQSERNIAHWHHVSEPYSHILTGDLPNYCNDLNAMHEAEKVLLSEFGNLAPYNKHLAYATCASGEPRYHATARQRAEAYLRTLGKWEEAAK